MKHNWEYKPFKQLSDILYGCPFESEFFNSESKGMPLIRIRDVKPGYTSTYFNGGYSDDYIIKKGDYLIGMDGEFNIAPWQSEDALLNQRVCRVKSINENVILSNFIYYFLGKELKDIEAQTSFVTVKHLSAKVLNAINTPVPPMEVQEQIVAELDTINETIEDCRELLRNLDALAQSLFYDFFGDPITNSKGWETSRFGELCKLSAGGDKPFDTQKEISKDFNIPIYSNGIENEGLYGYTSKPRITSPAITISGRGTLGVPFIRLKPFVPIIRLIVAIPSPVVNLTFLFYMIKLLKIGGKGAAIPQLTVPMVKDLLLPVPPLELQEKFAARIEQIEEQKKSVEQTIAELQTLLDSRMDYWFN